MKKSILEKIIAITLSMGFLAGVCLLEGMGLGELVDHLTFLFLAVAAYILLDDFLAMVFWYRYAITRNYLVYMCLYIASLVIFTGAFLSHSFGWGVGLLVGALVVFGLAFVLHVLCYRDDDYTAFESERLKWAIIREKLDGMTEEDVRSTCYSFLRFYPKRSLLKANLGLRDPVDTKHRNWTLAEIMEKDEDREYVSEVKARLDAMIDDYIIIRPEPTVEAVAKEDRK